MVLCVGGAIVVALENAGQGGEDHVVGYLWCLLSVVLYAGFEVMYKKKATSDVDPYPFANTLRFFGIMGFGVVATTWPMFFILDSTGYEKFEWPSRDAIPYILIVIATDVGFNIFLLLTILLSSPLFTAVGKNIKPHIL